MIKTILKNVLVKFDTDNRGKDLSCNFLNPLSDSLISACFVLVKFCFRIVYEI